MLLLNTNLWYVFWEFVFVDKAQEMTLFVVVENGVVSSILSRCTSVFLVSSINWYVSGGVILRIKQANNEDSKLSKMTRLDRCFLNVLAL